MGSFLVTDDGSCVIGWGAVSTGGPAFTEVGVDGGDLLDFTFPDGTHSCRAIKVPVAALDINVMRTSVGVQ
jgi:hypothetical protein